MTLKTGTAVFCAAAIFLSGTLSKAQDNTFDLSSQRHEEQNIRPVTGHVVDRGGIAVNPVPHEMRRLGTEVLDIRGGLTIKDRKHRFSDDLQGLAPEGKDAVLTIDFGPKYAARYGLKETSGAYFLEISGKDIRIAGYDETGAFYGIQTLRQLLRHGRLPMVEIRDWPDLPLRGVVEGFYGTPWSHEVRLSLIDFYGRFKMNTYVYGPKDDPYHSCPDWRKPYPADEAAQIRELVDACNRNHVDFVWAIHPGQDIKWNEEDYLNLVNKFRMMYDLGVRAFAIFFDDISGEGTNPHKQVELLNRLNREFVLAKGDVAPLIMCPTDYSRLWANPTPDGSLSIYGRTLDPSIRIFWTGDSVCSDLTAETMEWVGSRIRRPALYWWNFPVTDYARHIMMSGPAYGLDTSLTSDEVAGVLSNPMEHGSASKVALYGVADYAWNTAGYNAIDNWERALAELVPDAKEAFRTFAIHSCDTETGYRRAESWETDVFGINDYTDEEFEALRDEFMKIEKVPEQMEAGCRDTLLLAELRPWLTEFGRLGTRGLKTLGLIESFGKTDNETFWEAYSDNLMTDEEAESYSRHKSGTLRLQPFYERCMADLGDGLMKSLTGEESSRRRSIGPFANIRTMGNLMFDDDSTTFYTTGLAQKDGDWIGADLGKVTPVDAVRILQGRNSTDDTDYFDHVRLEWSPDGKTWEPLIDDIRDRYIIEWEGEPVMARYVRLLRLGSDKTNWAAVRSFDINPVTPERLGFEVTAEDTARAMAAFDRNPGTGYANVGTLTFGVPEDVCGYVILSGHTGDSGITVVQKSADGTVLDTLTTDKAYLEVVPADGATTIGIQGDTEIYEILVKRGGACDTGRQ